MKIRKMNYTAARNFVTKKLKNVNMSQLCREHHLDYNQVNQIKNSAFPKRIKLLAALIQTTGSSVVKIEKEVIYHIHENTGRTLPGNRKTKRS